MKKLVLVLAASLFLSSASLWAQDVPKAQIFGGFSALHISEDDFKQTPLGWQTQVAGNINKSFGIVGDVGGQYKTVEGFKLKVHSFLGGPQFTHRTDKAAVFVHAIYGLTHLGVSGGGESSSENDFTMGYGGGIDVRATDRISIRIIQFDWLPTKEPASNGGGWTKNITRYGFGIVFKGASK